MLSINAMKTTIIGSITIVIAIGNAALAFLKGGQIDLASTVTAVTAGVGLIKAADNKPKAKVQKP